MAIKSSLQEQKRLALGAYLPGADNKLAPREKHGRLRLAYFEFLTAAADANSKTVASGPLNIGDTLNLCSIPPGARIIGGVLAVDALGTGATAEVGIAGTLAQLLPAATSVASAGAVPLAATIAENYGIVENELKETQIVLTVAGANYANGANIKGHVLYVVD